MSTRVKICGVTSIADARAAVRAGADYLGVNFHRPSPRYVDPNTAAAIVAAAGAVPVVGVFVDCPRRDVAAIATQVGLSMLQFHGDESPADCAGWDRPVIKAVRGDPARAPAALAATYATDYILLDTHVPGIPGGTGVAIDPGLAVGIDRDRLFLAGGLRPETVVAAIQAVRPFAVDVASGVESEPGKKEHAKLEAFIRLAQRA